VELKEVKKMAEGKNGHVNPRDLLDWVKMVVSDLDDLYDVLVVVAMMLACCLVVMTSCLWCRGVV
jgi:hypothetical protein